MKTIAVPAVVVVIIIIMLAVFTPDLTVKRSAS